MVWLVAQDPDAEDRRYMVWIKGNLAPRQAGLAYRIMNVPITFKNRTSFYSCYNFEKEPVKQTAAELLAPKQKKSGRPKKQSEAAEWLESILSEGPVDSKLIYSEGEALGYSESTLKRTKKSIGVLGIPIRDKISGLVLCWEWRMPSS